MVNQRSAKVESIVRVLLLVFEKMAQTKGSGLLGSFDDLNGIVEREPMCRIDQELLSHTSQITSMPRRPFNRQEHVYRNHAFAELVKDGVRFFNGTPVMSLPPEERFAGTGVYAIYYTGKAKLYAKYAELNRLSYGYPIYVGKAVPKGWRQARVSHSETDQSTELHHRLREHSNSIGHSSNLRPSDFMCRFVIFEGEGSDMISTVEAALIKITRPLWNVIVDGFGNHDPGSGRYEQARSDWDVLHPGRPWAQKCKGVAAKPVEITARIASHLDSLGGTAV